MEKARTFPPIEVFKSWVLEFEAAHRTKHGPNPKSCPTRS